MVGTLILTLSIVTIEVVLIGAMALADTIEIACADFIRG
jgi:Ca2+/H+ antiporter